ncbi:WecB/TagA/CpsF family glycosyltransferase [Nitriliruptor alkaliphilus]|uniref:WecB/TagA/CpsF family glycosyltransferase n=1 Tax=Nitriliruptor alkaliphilus TaxID=427918 RepID=UPI0014700617|nr:WecB/TagA/CpsF family glycosyltransferase [Nitriliruptor alkaliphilus]
MPVAGIPIADVERDRVVATAASLIGTAIPRLIACVHVSGLLERNNARYVGALSAPDCLAYADGISVELLGRVAGAEHIQRCPMTDSGHELLDALSVRPRVALIGGPGGLAERAAERLVDRHAIDVVMVSDGFPPAWEPVTRQLREQRPDLVFVGLGTPYEVLWYDQHRDQLPPAVYLTAGGWFGHIVGDERRAPGWARRVGLEWMYRMSQRPRDLVPRYTRGAVTILRILPRTAIAGRRRRRDRDRRRA